MSQSTRSRLPDRTPLPPTLAPVPKTLEDLGLRFAWLIVAINLGGTVFGFWYYREQFTTEPVVMWIFVPDSPIATLLIALAIASWKLGHEQQWLTALAFFGNIILGLWTPFVLLAFYDAYAYLHPAMYAFLFVSHLGMVVQALVLHRITDFPVWAVAVASLWYGVDLLVDFFVPIVGDYHHTTLPLSGETPMYLGGTVRDIAGAGATTFTFLALFLALAIRVKKLEYQLSRPN